MPRRRLGRGELVVSGARPGCMGMSEFYGRRTKENPSPPFIAPSTGNKFFDTADMYGVAETKSWWDARSVAAGMKLFGHEVWDVRSSRRQGFWGEWAPRIRAASLRGEPAGVGVEKSIFTINIGWTPVFPLEETVGAMARTGAAGQVSLLGLRKPRPATVRPRC